MYKPKICKLRKLCLSYVSALVTNKNLDRDVSESGVLTPVFHGSGGDQTPPLRSSDAAYVQKYPPTGEGADGHQAINVMPLLHTFVQRRQRSYAVE